MRLRLTVPRVYGFERSVLLPSGALMTSADWDAVRLTSHPGAFGFEESTAEWAARAAGRADLADRAELVSELLAAWGVSQAVSVGVGTGMFEYLLVRAAPFLRLRCGDFAEASLERLRERLGDLAEVVRMDLHSADWVGRPEEPVIMHRVDGELSDESWRLTFERLARRQVQRIVWIPCMLLTPGAMTGELRSMASALLRRRRIVRAGYLRSEPRMLELFERFYRRRAVPRGKGLPLWILESRQ